MSELANQECVPCKGGVPPLRDDEAQVLLAQLAEGWSVVQGHHLEKLYTIHHIQAALDFTNRVGALAQDQGHHPDVYLAWGKVRLTIWTHKIDGLTQSDFIFAAKADGQLAP